MLREFPPVFETSRHNVLAPMSSDTLQRTAVRRAEFGCSAAGGIEAVSSGGGEVAGSAEQGWNFGPQRLLDECGGVDHAMQGR